MDVFLMLLATFAPILTYTFLLASHGGGANISPALEAIALISPITLTRAATSAPAATFYTGMALIGGLAIIQLALASFHVRRAWQTGIARPAPRTAIRKAAARARSRMRDQSPVEWLAGGKGRHNWIPAALLAMGTAVLFQQWPSEMSTALPVIASHLLPYVLGLFIASRATMFFLGLRQNGGMELIFSTPLTDRDIVSGQWSVLRHRYLPFAVFILALIWLPTADWNPYPNMRSYYDNTTEWMPLVMVRLYLPARCLLLWLAAGWAGMYFALNSKSLLFVRLKTFLVGVIVPWIFFCIPEPFMTILILGVCQSGVPECVRSRALQRAERGQID